MKLSASIVDCFSCLFSNGNGAWEHPETICRKLNSIYLIAGVQDPCVLCLVLNHLIGKLYKVEFFWVRHDTSNIEFFYADDPQYHIGYLKG